MTPGQFVAIVLRDKAIDPRWLIKDAESYPIIDVGEQARAIQDRRALLDFIEHTSILTMMEIVKGAK